jgi:hypothetical protein
MTTYRGKTVAYYGALTLVLILITTHALPHLLPHGIASSIGHNSEAFLFAIGFCAMVQFLLPWLRRRALNPLLVAGPASAVCFGFAYFLVESGWPASLVTLNEPVIALGLMFLYVCLPRPVRYAPLLAAAVLALVVVFFHTQFVFDQAESLVPALLAPLALDVFDRTILERLRPDNPRLRLLWMGFLLALAVGLIFAARWARSDLQGPLRLGVDYAQRAAEAYWGWLFVHAYFGMWIGRARGWSHQHGSPRVVSGGAFAERVVG